MSIRIVLSDDHVLVRQGIKAILENEGFTIVGEASDGQEAIRLSESLQPDVAVLDVSMPLLNGISTAREIAKCCPSTKCILLTVHTEQEYVLESLSAGIAGYVLKTKAAAELVEAIREVSRGGTFLSPTISGMVVKAYLESNVQPRDPLSDRERQVLQLIAEGKSTKEIASLLGISPKTGESHRAKIMEKLNLHDTASLVRYAIRHRLIES